jgi:phosphoglycolate phosphatase-like HAD superfamily hydrolase
MFKVLVFDFDGVIIDSERSKQEAWVKLFKPLGSKAVLLAYKAKDDVFKNRQGAREDMLTYIFHELKFSSDVIGDYVSEYSRRYDEDVQKEVNIIGVRTDVKEILKRFSKTMPLYVNSVTPDASLKNSLDLLKIRPLFKGVKGGSRSKADNLCAIMEAEGVASSETLFVGDGLGDFLASQKSHCHFLGLATSLNHWSKARQPFPVAERFADIPTAVENWYAQANSSEKFLTKNGSRI